MQCCFVAAGDWSHKSGKLKTARTANSFDTALFFNSQCVCFSFAQEPMEVSNALLMLSRIGSVFPRVITQGNVLCLWRCVTHELGCVGVMLEQAISRVIEHPEWKKTNLKVSWFHNMHCKQHIPASQPSLPLCLTAIVTLFSFRCWRRACKACSHKSAKPGCKKRLSSLAL